MVKLEQNNIWFGATMLYRRKRLTVLYHVYKENKQVCQQHKLKLNLPLRPSSIYNIHGDSRYSGKCRE
jgi:hypothetical protein